MSDTILRIINKFPSDFALALTMALTFAAAADRDAFWARYDNDLHFRKKLQSNCIFNKKTYDERIIRVFPELVAMLKPELRDAEMLLTWWESNGWKAISLSERSVRRCLEHAAGAEEFIAQLKIKPSIYLRLEEMMQEVNV